MESVKTWLVEVGLKKIGPTAMASLVASGLALAAAHQGLLETWGITVGQWPLVWPSGQVPSGPVILIELDTVSTSALVIIGGLIMSMMGVAQHHVGAALRGEPQSGDLRKYDVPVANGQRSTDAPKGAA